MTSGRWRVDKPLDLFYSKREQQDSDLLLDDVSEVPEPPVEREPYHEGSNEGTPLRQRAISPDPIAVRVVPGTDPKYTNHTAHGYSVVAFSGVPKQILNANDNRTRALVRNVLGASNATIYVGSTADEAKADGYPLVNGAELNVFGTGPLWGCVKTTTPTDTVTLGVFVEYDWPNG